MQLTENGFRQGALFTNGATWSARRYYNYDGKDLCIYGPNSILIHKLAVLGINNMQVLAQGKTKLVFITFMQFNIL